ncbi:MAG: hypothetical protein QXV70_04560 [Saccharolobus sp.]
MFNRFILSPIFLTLSVISYYFARDNTLLFSLISTISFWAFIILILPNSFYTFLRNLIVKFKKSKLFWVIFIIYMLYHVILYSFFFYLLSPGSITTLHFSLSVNAGIGYSIPPPLPYFLQWVSTSPAIWFFIGPYEGDIIPFSTFIGVTLAILIGLNAAEIGELWGVSKRSIIIVPSLGLISGSSCCIFLPSIVMYSIALSVTSVTAIILSILSSFTYFVIAYYGLPIISTIVLFHNLKLLDKLLYKIKEK